MLPLPGQEPSPGLDMLTPLRHHAFTMNVGEHQFTHQRPAPAWRRAKTPMKSASITYLSVLSLTLVFATAALRAGLVSPDGKLVAYTISAYDEDGSLYNEIFIRASDGSSPKTLGQAAGQRDQVSWIGNDRIALSEFASSDVFAVFDISGKRLADIVLPPDCDALYMAVSPDGQKVTFTGSRKAGDKKQYGLFVYDIKSGAVKLLIEEAIKTLAAWSPDSQKLALGVGVGYTRNHPLQIVDVSSGKVDDTGVLGAGASWSPDGKHIACTADVQRGGGWFAGVPMSGKLGLYNVEQRQTRVVAGTDGALHPAWSKSGNLVAYLAGGKIGITSLDGGTTAIVQPTDGDQFKATLQMGWVGDEALYIRTENNLARFDVAQGKLATVVQWDAPKAPDLKPQNFQVLELPRVTVRYARIDKKYAEAFGNILAEALKVYESHGFKMPGKVSLEIQIDPSSTRLWTDGDSQMFLHLKSKELLAPATKTGVFNIYGMCHELGHIAMYRSMENLMGLPPGVGEGWAHYAGSVVVTEVADKLGKSIWPEYYDIADVEGIGRLKRTAAQAESWDKMDSTTRAALVFYKMETEFGRDKLAAAMTAALAERPTGKALMPLLLVKLRTVTSNPTAADWVPESMLVPQVDWQTKERNPGPEFFADQKIEQEGDGLWLFYDDGTMEDKLSMSGSAETVLFRLPEGSWQFDGLKLFSARYGADEPPREDISIYLCDANFNLLREVKVPYANLAKGREKWQSVSFPPVDLPQIFYVGIDFHATAQKGVYVGMDKNVKRSHSRVAMPYAEVSDMKTTADWMIRAHLSPQK